MSSTLTPPTTSSPSSSVVNDEMEEDNETGLKSIKSNYYKSISIQGHTNTVSSVKFSPNGLFFASGCKKNYQSHHKYIQFLN